MRPDEKDFDDIPIEFVIGRKYHCSWARVRAMVWVLKAINGEDCLLEARKSKKIVVTKLSALRDLNKNSNGLQKQKLKSK